MNTKLKLLLASLLTTTMAFAGDGTTASTLPGAIGGTQYGGESITNSLSPHNIGTNNGVAGDNSEVCVYCHTPHAANATFAGAPIWNKADVSKATFTTYGTTIGGTTAGTDNTGVGNPSLACLSCHDGVSAIDSILNAPGSGMNTIAGSKLITGITTGALDGTSNIGKDLTNDHPISITYNPGRASLRATTYSLPVGSDIAWVTPGGAGTIASLLRGTGSDQVECSSCHDPHNATGLPQTGAGKSTQVNYLRHSNKNSDLCFGCHAK